MTFKFEYHHPDADLTFRWDGWMQVMIRLGPSVPYGAYADRFDIREPDLRIKNFFNDNAYDPSVHFVPRTQEAFEEMCDQYFRGKDIAPGLRDYTLYPWTGRSFGWSSGELEFRYTGGLHIEVTPQGRNDWQPLIELAASGRTLTELTTRWLMSRLRGWELAVFESLGVTGATEDFDRARTAFITRVRPPAKGQCVAGNWSDWIGSIMAAAWADGTWIRFQDLGGCHRNGDSPWHAQRTDAAGARWNFAWNGNPRSYVYSPDLGHVLPDGQERFLPDRPYHMAPRGADLYEWLDQQADAWTNRRNAEETK
ncbi:hypothetical protein ACWD0G_10970 [Streptomyces goshikiensis]